LFAFIAERVCIFGGVLLVTFLVTVSETDSFIDGMSTYHFQSGLTKTGQILLQKVHLIVHINGQAVSKNHRNFIIYESRAESVKNYCSFCITICSLFSNCATYRYAVKCLQMTDVSY